MAPKQKKDYPKWLRIESDILRIMFCSYITQFLTILDDLFFVLELKSVAVPAQPQRVWVRYGYSLIKFKPITHTHKPISEKPQFYPYPCSCLLTRALVAFPADQVKQLTMLTPPVNLRVKNLRNFEFGFSVDDYRRRRTL